MPDYVWQAKTKDGELKKGVMDAASVDMVNSRLRQQNLQPIKVNKKLLPDLSKLTIGGSVSQKDLVIFTRQFSTMIDAGLPLVQCLEILGNQCDNPFFQKIIIDIKNNVEGGTTFADALRKHPKVFDRLFVNMVDAGEAGGILDNIMNRLAGYIEKSMAIKKKVKSAMAYPIGMLIVALLVLAVLMIYVIPKFKTMFADLGDEGLPPLTKIVITMSEFVQNNIGMIFIVLIGSFMLIKQVAATKGGGRVIDIISLKVPIIGSLLTRVAVAKFCRTLATMLQSGVPILDSLDIVAKTSGNMVVEAAIYKARDHISEGKGISEPLAEAKIFPGMVIQMIAVGEQTGAMDVMLNKIADFYDQEVDTAVDALTSILEPLMMVVLGGMVGFFLIAMYLPIFDLAKTF